MSDEKDKALIVFDYIYHAMRAKHVLESNGYDIKEVAPPVDYRTGCDLALEIDTDLVDEAEDLLIEKDVLILDILFVPQSTQLTPIYLTKLIKVQEYEEHIMVRCGNMKVTFEKETGKIVNISGGGCPDIPYLGMKLYGTVLGEGPRPRELGKTICAYTCEHAYEKALEVFNDLKKKKRK